MTLRAESRLDGSSRTTPIGYTTGIGALTAVGLLSALVSLLYLTGSLFMLEVYDRVIARAFRGIKAGNQAHHKKRWSAGIPLSERGCS